MNNQHEPNIANSSVASLIHSDAMTCAFWPSLVGYVASYVRSLELIGNFLRKLT